MRAAGSEAMTRPRALAALSIALFAVAPAAAWAEPIPAIRTAAGEEIYARECATCHGAELEGQPDWRTANEDGTLPAPPHGPDGHTWHHPDSLLVAYTKFGGTETLRRMGVTGFASAMPAFGETLSDAEIRAVIAYIKSFWPDEAREYQAERTRAEDGD